MKYHNHKGSYLEKHDRIIKYEDGYYNIYDLENRIVNYRTDEQGIKSRYTDLEPIKSTIWI